MDNKEIIKIGSQALILKMFLTIDNKYTLAVSETQFQEIIDREILKQRISPAMKKEFYKTLLLTVNNQIGKYERATKEIPIVRELDVLTSAKNFVIYLKKIIRKPEILENHLPEIFSNEKPEGYTIFVRMREKFDENLHSETEFYSCLFNYLREKKYLTSSNAKIFREYLENNLGTSFSKFRNRNSYKYIDLLKKTLSELEIRY